MQAQNSVENTPTREWVKHWYLPGWDELLFVKAHFTRHAFPSHCHDEFMIEAVETGVEKFRHKGATHYASRGQLVVINPDEVHDATSGSDEVWQYRAVYPSIALLQRLASEAELPISELGFQHALISDAHLLEKFQNAHEVAEQGVDGLEQESVMVEFLTDVLARLATKKPSYGREHKAVQQIKDYLEDYATHAVSLDDLKSVTGFSSHHLLKVFKQHTGLSPHQYQTQLRMRLAYQKVLSGTASKDLATDVGFFDQSHFIKVFRRYYGTTPAKLKPSKNEATREG
jgi:AraC-like DNA-binding protein